MAKKKNNYQNILNSFDYKNALPGMAKRIVSQSMVAPNEATVESYFERELFAFFREKFSIVGFDYNPIKEKNVCRHMLKGRADSALSSFIIEFKQPSTLKNAKQKEKAINQIKEYIESLWDGNYSLFHGFITDGVQGCFLNYNGKEFKTEKFLPVDSFTLDKLIKCIINVELIELNGENLVKLLCNPPEYDGVAFQLAKVLYDSIECPDSFIPKTQMLFNEWKQLFNLAHDDVSKQQAIIDRRRALEKIFKVTLFENENEYKALFCIQTAYAIIIKLIAFKVVSQIKYKQTILNLGEIINYESETLRSFQEDLENGAIFRNYGILNLLEGDFFSWYVNPLQWTTIIANSITNVYIVLSRFSDSPTLKNGRECEDFFKELYQTMVPAAVRHSLGEYYTKKWLARSVIDEIKDNLFIEWRALDPCCGSGTFITCLIEKILSDNHLSDRKALLNNILSRVKGIDLNPIAVMTARINYFLNISMLIDEDDTIEIPIYLGDASYVPRRVEIDDVECFEYTISTIKEPINIKVPTSILRDIEKFSQTMNDIETDIKALDKDEVYNKLATLCEAKDLTPVIVCNLKELSSQLVGLEESNWNGVWARIITNFLTTANLGKFDLVVGNPPWVDWKNLPSGYRDRIKSLCISRKLFSGDRITGGINLNICALITSVAAQNWLRSYGGILAFLMPEPLIFQQSYEGFRNLQLDNNEHLYFQKIVNWNKAGHPFNPVTQKFLTYYIGREEVDYKQGIPVKHYIKNISRNIDNYENLNVEEVFKIQEGFLGVCSESKNNFCYAGDRQTLEVFKKIAGNSKYRGREGIEFYPQELLVFTLSDLPQRNGLTALKNMQNDRSKYHIPSRQILMETEFLHPMIKGKDIKPFHVDISDYIVPFPYEKENPRLPISHKALRKKAPMLAKYYQENKNTLKDQSEYNDRIIGRDDAEYYALARVGAYSYQKYYVVMRDNTKWAAAVISDIKTSWGGKKRPVFQNHAISICENGEGKYINLSEAHYICGILNSSVVYNYMMTSSDSRSFPIELRIRIPKYNPKNEFHKQISNYSKQAHKCYNNDERLKEIIKNIDILYLKILE